MRYNETHAAAWARLAQLYATSGRVRMAEAALLNAANTHRGNPATLDLIGTVFRLAGNLEGSREWHRKAVDADPTHVAFMVNLANAETFCGNLEVARQWLERCLELQPGNAQAHWLLSRVRPAESRTHVDAMRNLLDSNGSLDTTAYLNYAIGKELEDMEDWEDAFEAILESSQPPETLIDEIRETLHHDDAPSPADAARDGGVGRRQDRARPSPALVAGDRGGESAVRPRYR